MSKCAIVTGASRGLGLALTRRLSSEGWTVIVDSRDRRELENATFRLPGVHAIPGDVSDPYHQQILIEAARTTGRLDLLVNNASALGPTPLPALADANLRSVVRTFEVNVFAPLGLIQLALPLLAESEGAIVNVTSDAAVESYPGWGVYGASKAALEQASRVLAAERPDIPVYWVDPGDMRTRMHEEAVGGSDISHLPPPEDSVPGIMELITRRPPSGRYRVQRLENVA
jgi:NAD(P)-dependent dehydrogenase (short-subunit alcohol dehydrogenase family)